MLEQTAPDTGTAMQYSDGHVGHLPRFAVATHNDLDVSHDLGRSAHGDPYGSRIKISVKFEIGIFGQPEQIDENPSVSVERHDPHRLGKIRARGFAADAPSLRRHQLPSIAPIFTRA